MLEEKNLWSIIKDNRHKFTFPFPRFNNDAGDTYDEMYRLGLFTDYDRFHYTLSDSGRTFINLLEAEEIREGDV